ncbi:MAG: peptidase C39 family protein [Nanoarchaeota archaeon]
MSKFPFHKQETKYTCGAAATRMALETCGIKKTEKQVVKLLKTNKIRGSWVKNFPVVAEQFMLNYVVKRNATINDLRKTLQEGYAVVLAYLYPPEKVDHYVVVRRIDSNFIYFWDPWFGPEHKYTLKHFEKIWAPDPRFENQKRWFIGMKR